MGIGKVRNFTAQFRGRSSLTAVAPSIFWPALPRAVAGRPTLAGYGSRKGGDVDFASLPRCLP